MKKHILFLLALSINVFVGGIALSAGATPDVAYGISGTLTAISFIDLYITPIIGIDAIAFNANAGVGLARERIVSTFDILKPEVRAELYRRRGDQGLSLFEKFESLGYMEKVSRSMRKTYEDDWIHQTIFLDDDGAGAAFTPAAGYNTSGNANAGKGTITLGNSGSTNSFIQYDDGSTYPVGQNGAYNGNPAYAHSASTSLYAMPVQLNDRLRFKGGEVAQIISISGAGTNNVQLTIKFTNFNNKIDAANYNVGDEISIITNAWSAGSKQPRGTNVNVIADYAYTQILKGGFDIDGSSMTNQNWFNAVVSDEGGKQTVIGYELLGQQAAEYEMRMKWDNMILFEQPATLGDEYIDPLTDEPVVTTEGLFPYAKRVGHTVPTVPGTIGLGLFNYVSKVLDKEQSPEYSAFLQGFDLNLELQGVLKDYNQNTGINEYTKKKMVADLFGSNEKLAMEVDFGSFRQGRFTFCFSVLPQLTHPKIHPVGYPTGNYGLFMPLGKTRDPKDINKQKPYVGMIYKGLGEYSRKAEVWSISGAGPGDKIIEDDLKLLCMRSEVGCEHIGGNRFVFLNPAY